MSLSDADIFSSLTGGQPSQDAAPQPASIPAVSDDQIFKHLTSGAKSPPPAPAPAGQLSPGKRTFLGHLGNAIDFPLAGFGDELMAAGGAGRLTLDQIMAGKSATIGQNYDNALSQVRGARSDVQEADPVASVAESLPGLLGGAPEAAASLGRAGASGIRNAILRRMAEGSIMGGTYGAAYGLGSGEGGADHRLSGAAEGAGMGELTGGLIPVAGAGATQLGRLLGKGAAKLYPSIDQIAAGKAKGIINSFAGGNLNPDSAELVTGSKPTLAEATGNPGVAALTRAIRDINPNSPFIARDAQNSAARTSFLEKTTGTPEDIKTAAKARGKAADGQLKAVFAQKLPAPADINPVADQISETLSGPSGNRPAVKKAMEDVQGMMTDAKGQPITDPETLYHSVRKGIGDLISGKDLTKSYGAQAASELMAVRDKLDDVIETGAPGFKNYLHEYAESSVPITSMKFLQGLNLTDAQGKITLSKVQGALRKLQTQQAEPGVKPGKAVSEAQQTALESIRDDLLRAQNIGLGKAIGSNTVQNALAQKRLGLASGIKPEMIGGGLGTAVGGFVGGEPGAAVGATLGSTVGKGVSHFMDNRNALMQNATQSQIEEMLLNPAHYQNPQVGASQIPSLNQLLSGSRANTLFTGANKLAIANNAQSKQHAGKR